MRHTGGFAFGATRTKSRFNLAAISSASCRDLIPNCSPFGSIKRTSRARMFSLIIKSLLITSHLQGFFPNYLFVSQRTLTHTKRTVQNVFAFLIKKCGCIRHPHCLRSKRSSTNRNDLSTAESASTRWEAGCFCFCHKQVYSIHFI